MEYVDLLNSAPIARWWVAWDTGLHTSPRTNTQGVWGEIERGIERMSEATGRTEIERRIVQRSLQDDAFRQRLLADPRAAVEEELGTRLPEEVRVVAVEETADTAYLVLPPGASPSGETGELSDRELEAVAGGWLEDPAHSQAFPTEACGC
jgi:hypothetical protein